MNFLELLEKQAKQHSDKPAIIFGDRAITFQAIKELSLELSLALARCGIKKSERVAIFLPNIPQYIYSFFGVFLLRGICVPLDFMLTEEEVIGFINHSESRVLLAQNKKGFNFQRIKENCPKLKEIVLFNEASASWEGFLPGGAQDFKSLHADENDPAVIFYTSGSTGHPKGVLLNYSHLKNPLDCFEYYLKPEVSDSLLCAGVPFSHIGGLDYALFMLHFGITLVLMERFHPLEFLKAIERYKTTIFCIVPAMYVAVLSLKEYDKFDLSSLRFAVVFGAPSSPVLLERFHKACPNAYLLNGWGMTETAAPNVFLPTGTNTKEIPNTGKFPPTTEVKITDADGNTLPDEKEGELWIRGKAVMAGYYKEPELTASVLTPGGWLKTGDVARRDKLGRYSIVGRKKEMIKVAGEIVFEPEIEALIQRHPAVAEVAVVGIADNLRGEVPKAYVALKEGTQVTEEELRYFCRQHLAHFKTPHYFEFRAVLPKNRVGKIDKESLRKVQE